MSAIATGFFALWLALALWVYFDATERGKAAIPWAAAVFFLGLFGAVPLILYVIFRDTGQQPVVPPGGARRQAVYIVSFAGLATLLIGFSLIGSVTMVRALSEDAISDDGFREALASSIAAIVIGGLAWASQWFQATPRLASLTDDQEFRATFYLHRAYLYTVFGVSWAIAFIAGLWFLGGALANALDVEDVEPELWLAALGPLVGSLLMLGFHYSFCFETPEFMELRSRFEKIPAPPLTAAPARETAAPSPPRTASAPPPSPAAAPERRFCSQCGVAAQVEDSFCSRCGARLRPAEDTA